MNSYLSIQRQHLESDHRFFNPGWFSANEVTIYQVKNFDASFPISKDELVAYINFSLDTQQINYSRKIYNALDLIGDVGGLFEGLKVVAYLTMSLFTPLRITNFFISKLYFTKKDNSSNIDVNSQ